MMTLQAIIYLLCCSFLPWLLAGPRGGRNWDWPSRLAVTLLLFFVPLLLLGAVGLLWGCSLLGVGLAATLAAILAVAFGLAARAGSLPWKCRLETSTTRLHWESIAAVVCVISAGLLLAGLLLFDFPRGYEPRAYHMPIAVNVFRTANIEPWDLAFMHMYPANQSLFAAFLLTWLPERAISPANILSLGLCAAVTYALSLRAGADRGAALLVAAGICTIPLFGFSACELGADLGGTATLGLAAYLTLGTEQTGSVRAVLAGLVAGLAFGFKSLHLIPIAMLGFLILAMPVHAGKTGILKSRLVNASAYGVAILVTAGPWWLRSYLATGNPLYPVHIAPVFDWLNWPAAPDFNIAERGGRQNEWVRSSSGWLAYPWVEWHYIGQNYKHSSGLGAFFAAAIAPALLIGVGELVSTFRRWTTAANAVVVRAGLVVLALAILIGWWALGDRQPRYFMGAIILTAPIAAHRLSELTGARRRVLESVWLGCILLMLALIGAQLTAEVAGRLGQSPDVVRHEVLGYVSALDSLPESSVVVNCVGRPLNYALFGDRLANKVISYSAARSQFRSAESEDWHFTVEALRELRATHIYIGDRSNWSAADGVRLVPVDRLARNPYNGAPLVESFTLYRVDLSN